MDDESLRLSALRWLRQSDLCTAEIDDPAELAATADDPRKAIADKIRECDTLLLVWTRNAAKSAWVNYELAFASALGKKIRVLLAGGEESKIPIELPKTNIAELNTAAQ